MTHNFSDTPEEKTPTTWQLLGRVALLAILGIAFWAATWIFA